MEIHKKLKNLCRALLQEEGSAIIEMAIVVPVVMTLIMGIIEFSILFHLSSLMTYAGDEAARLGKTGGTYGYSSAECIANNSCREELTLSTIRNRMKDWVHDDKTLVITQKSYGKFEDINVAGAGVAGAGAGGQIVLYTITLNWKLLTPLIGRLIGGSTGTIPITTKVLVKNENF